MHGHLRDVAGPSKNCTSDSHSSISHYLFHHDIHFVCSLYSGYSQPEDNIFLKLLLLFSCRLYFE